MPRKPVIIYLIFAGPNFYPKGGFYDLKATTFSKDSALKQAKELRRTNDWCEIVAMNPKTLFWQNIDLETGEAILP